MSDVQDKWNDYYADKKWVDTKGWCHLDGTPFTFKELVLASGEISHIKSL